MTTGENALYLKIINIINQLVMTIKEILTELSEFSPELFQGNEKLEADHVADSWLSYYDAEAVFVADDFPLNMPAFENAGTVIVSEDLMPFVSSLTINVIIVDAAYLEDVRRLLETLLD